MYWAGLYAPLLLRDALYASPDSPQSLDCGSRQPLKPAPLLDQVNQGNIGQRGHFAVVTTQSRYSVAHTMSRTTSP
jgi:hypothetical protein